MITIETITAALAILPTLGLTITGIAYYKQNRRLKDAEVQKEEANAKFADIETQLKALEVKEREEERYNKRVDVLHEDIDTLNTQLKEALQSKAKSEEIIDDKTVKIRELNETIFELQNRLVEKENLIGRLKLFIHWLKHWHCKRETGNKKGQCSRRIPEQSVPTPFQEFPDKSLLAEVGIEEGVCEVEEDE